MTIYQITHQTQYQYEKEVARCHNVAHLVPRSFFYQQCLDVQIDILPQPDVCLERQDYFGNQIIYFDFVCNQLTQSLLIPGIDRA